LSSEFAIVVVALRDLRENRFDDVRIFDTGDDAQRTAAVWTLLDRAAFGSIAKTR